jgi:glycosyltransferase involved in cell wall biosynthesis
MNNMEQQPLVSICCITYNHENYIEKAIKGFLLQKTKFSIEIIIHDDASKDGTPYIIKEYSDKYPDIIKTILQNENQFSKGGSISARYVWPKAKGKYIALCEGDDYWTDPYKLQKQVDFLEENEDYSICFHPVKIEKDGELVDDYITKEVPETTNIYDLAKGSYIHTPSIMFRSSLLNSYPTKFIKAPVGDYLLLLFLAQFGKIKKLNDVAAVYRVHHTSMWSSIQKSIRRDKIIKYHEIIIPYFSYNKRVFRELNSRWQKLSKSRFIDSIKKKSYMKAIIYIFKYFGLVIHYQILKMIK